MDRLRRYLYGKANATIDRIDYAAKGCLVDYDELLVYVKWLEKRIPIFRLIAMARIRPKWLRESDASV